MKKILEIKYTPLSSNKKIYPLYVVTNTVEICITELFNNEYKKKNTIFKYPLVLELNNGYSYIIVSLSRDITQYDIQIFKAYNILRDDDIKVQIYDIISCDFYSKSTGLPIGKRKNVNELTRVVNLSDIYNLFYPKGISNNITLQSNIIDDLTWIFNYHIDETINLLPDPMIINDSIEANQKLTYLQNLKNKFLNRKVRYEKFDIWNGYNDNIDLSIIKDKIFQASKKSDNPTEEIDDILRTYFIGDINDNIIYSTKGIDGFRNVIIKPWAKFIKYIGADLPLYEKESEDKKDKKDVVIFGKEYSKWRFSTVIDVINKPSTIYQPLDSLCKINEYVDIFIPFKYCPAFNIGYRTIYSFILSDNILDANIEYFLGAESKLLQSFFFDYNIETNDTTYSDILKSIIFLKDHIKKIVCTDNNEKFHYLLEWMLHKVKYPRKQISKILMFLGDEGTGKSIILKSFIETCLNNINARVSSKLDDYIRQFTGPLHNLVVFLYEEAKFSKHGSSNLKQLVTSRMFDFENKTKTPFFDENFIDICCTTNSTNYYANFAHDTRRWIPFSISRNLINLETPKYNTDLAKSTKYLPILLEAFHNIYHNINFNFDVIPIAIKNEIESQMSRTLLPEIVCRFSECIQRQSNSTLFNRHLPDAESHYYTMTYSSDKHESFFGIHNDIDDDYGIFKGEDKKLFMDRFNVSNTEYKKLMKVFNDYKDTFLLGGLLPGKERFMDKSSGTFRIPWAREIPKSRLFNFDSTRSMMKIRQTNQHLKDLDSFFTGINCKKFIKEIYCGHFNVPHIQIPDYAYCYIFHSWKISNVKLPSLDLIYALAKDKFDIYCLEAFYKAFSDIFNKDVKSCGAFLNFCVWILKHLDINEDYYNNLYNNISEDFISNLFRYNSTNPIDIERSELKKTVDGDYTYKGNIIILSQEIKKYQHAKYCTTIINDRFSINDLYELKEDDEYGNIFFQSMMKHKEEVDGYIKEIDREINYQISYHGKNEGRAMCNTKMVIDDIYLKGYFYKIFKLKSLLANKSLNYKGINFNDIYTELDKYFKDVIYDNIILERNDYSNSYIFTLNNYYVHNNKTNEEEEIEMDLLVTQLSQLSTTNDEEILSPPKPITDNIIKKSKRRKKVNDNEDILSPPKKKKKID